VDGAAGVVVTRTIGPPSSSLSTSSAKRGFCGKVFLQASEDLDACDSNGAPCRELVLLLLLPDDYSKMKMFQ
jgi:hypothetical protein